MAVCDLDHGGKFVLVFEYLVSSESRLDDLDEEFIMLGFG